MATKTIVTRIKNKVDTLAAWQSYTGTLLNGEIAVVRVPTGTSYTNPVTGADEPVVELLMKVGDGVHKFNEVDENGNPYLPWMSAKASDVYDWGKAATVEFNTSTYQVEFKDASGNVILAVSLAHIDSRLDALETNKLSDITVTQSGSGGVVQSVTKSKTGEITVTNGTVAAGDIASNAVTEAKIATDAVTEDKIKDGAVTNDKVATGVSSDKISMGTGTTAGTLSAKISDMDSKIAANANAAAHDHPYLPNTTKYAGSSSVGGAATSANKVNKSLTVKLNSGSTENTDLFTFNGSAAKSINITPSAIGAATAGDVSELTTQVNTNKSDIESLKTAVAGGVHFVGVVTAAPTTASVTVNGSNTHTAAAGDVVLWAAEGREYIYTGSAWEELGDVTRIGELETKVKNLKTTATNTVESTNKFVSQVTQSEGQISVTYTQPTSANVSHGGSTVKAALENLAANKSDSDHTHTISANAEDDDVVILEGTSGTDSVKYKATHKTYGTTDTTYRSVTVDKYGHVKSGSNPTTLSGYGITDAYTKSEVYTKSDVYTKTETNAELAKKADTHNHPYLPDTTKYAASSSVGGAATSANKVNKAITFNNSGSGVASGTTFDGSTARTISYNTIGAAASNHGHSAHEARTTAIEGNYVRFNSTDSKLYVGKDGADEIIFDCGGAE